MTKERGAWYCVSCDAVLGHLHGSELIPDGVPSENIMTSGSNVVISCPECESKKVWYSSDPITRAFNQLISVITDQAARSVTTAIGRYVHVDLEKTLRDRSNL